MLKSRKGSGIYRDTLNRDARDRYGDNNDKISIINNLDPYEVPAAGSGKGGHQHGGHAK
jgi:hypothetical protein